MEEDISNILNSQGIPILTENSYKSKKKKERKKIDKH